MSDYITALIRTVVPMLVGAVTAWLTARGIKVDDAGLITALTAALSALYYAAVAKASTRWPALGILLGVAKAPTYPAPAPAEPASWGPLTGPLTGPPAEEP